MNHPDDVIKLKHLWNKTMVTSPDGIWKYVLTDATFMNKQQIKVSLDYKPPKLSNSTS